MHGRQGGGHHDCADQPWFQSLCQHAYFRCASRRRRALVLLDYARRRCQSLGRRSAIFARLSRPRVRPVSAVAAARSPVHAREHSRPTGSAWACSASPIALRLDGNAFSFRVSRSDFAAARAAPACSCWPGSWPALFWSWPALASFWRSWSRCRTRCRWRCRRRCKRSRRRSAPLPLQVLGKPAIAEGNVILLERHPARHRRGVQRPAHAGRSSSPSRRPSPC